MTISVIRAARHACLGLLAGLLSAAALAQDVPSAPAAAGVAVPAPAPGEGALAPVGPGDLAAAGLSPDVVQRIAIDARPDGTIHVALVLDGAPSRLVLRPHVVRAPGFVVRVPGADGVLVDVGAPPPATWRGIVEGLPLGRVAATLAGGRLTALVRRSPVEPVFVVQPWAAGTAADHVVMRADEARAPALGCGLEASTVPTHGGGAGVAGAVDEAGAPAALAGPTESVRIACDADVEFFGAFGSVAAVVAEIEATINAVGAIYLDTAAAEYELTQIIVRTTEPDPYGTSSPGALLDAFTAEWNANQTAVDRHLAHLFTGKELSGTTIGIARLDADFCARGAPDADAYALSQTTFTFNVAWRVGLVAHEIGHNWGALHCNGAADCAIMCATIAGCSGDLTQFGNASTIALNAKKNSVPCFTTGAPPALLAVEPAQAPSFAPGPLSALGGNLAGVTSVTVDGEPVPFTVATTDLITFTPPAPATLGEVEVVLTNPKGSSAAATFAFVANDPPVLSAPALLATLSPFDWAWGAGPAQTIGLLGWTSDTTVPVGGYDVLASFVLVTVATTDAAGLGGDTFVPPASVAGVTFFTQVVAFDEDGFVGASGTPSSWVVF